MIKVAKAADIHTVASLAQALWPENQLDALISEYAALLARSDAQIFLLYDSNQPIGFAQCQLRHDYVEGTSTSPVGYLEGIYVHPHHRRQGHARALLVACQDWAKANGCREFASDCELHNHTSAAFHKALHFQEANRIICFTKKL